MLTKEISKVENKVKELRKRGYTTENTNDCTLDNEAILFIKSQAKLSTLKYNQEKFNKFIKSLQQKLSETMSNDILEYYMDVINELSSKQEGKDE
jgi:hypothetical protein